MAASVSVGELLEGHVALEVACLDRIYLNAYVPNLQVGGQVVTFLTQHRSNPIPSPALFARIGNHFRNQVARYARAHGVPLLRFAKRDRKIDVVRPLLQAAERQGRSGVVAIGVTQEFQNVFTATRRRTAAGPPQFAFRKEDRRVSCFYFYIWDEDFGPGFIKLCSYFPYPGKCWINGHKWAKRQAAKAQIGFAALSNGFAACPDPARLQYLKDGRALRIDTVVNTPDDLGVGRRLPNLPALVAKARAANRRILQVQRGGQGCAIGTATFERIQQPYAREGQRTGALRFGDLRVMALAGALCLTLHAVTGVSNRSLRALVAGLLGSPYSASQMTYDLRRLRLHGLIRRLDHRHRDVLTDDGQRFAVFYTKLGERVLPALFAADQPNSPPQLRHALRVIGGCIDDSLHDAGLAAA